MQNDPMRVSVVIPTCGRPDLLERCLAAVVRQSLEPAGFEIIVVDDAPARSTLDVVARYSERYGPTGLRIRYLPAEASRHGPAAARNLGWRQARSDIVAFTDDDTEPDPDWLAKGLRAFGPGVEVVCGRMVMPIPERPTDYELDANGLERSEFVTANCLCRRGTLERLQGFDERFRLAWREDSDLHFRLLESGACIVRAPDAVVVHPVRPARWGVSLKQQKKVLFDALLFKKHRKLYREHIRPAPRWDYYLIVGCLVATVLCGLLGQTREARMGALAWAALTAGLCVRRLRGTSKTPAHVAEMILTSALIPPIAVFWRLVGALKFKVIFV